MRNRRVRRTIEKLDIRAGARSDVEYEIAQKPPTKLVLTRPSEHMPAVSAQPEKRWTTITAVTDLNAPAKPSNFSGDVEHLKVKDVDTVVISNRGGRVGHKVEYHVNQVTATAKGAKPDMGLITQVIFDDCKTTLEKDPGAFFANMVFRACIPKHERPDLSNTIQKWRAQAAVQIDIHGDCGSVTRGYRPRAVVEHRHIAEQGGVPDWQLLKENPGLVEATFRHAGSPTDRDAANSFECAKSDALSHCDLSGLLQTGAFPAKPSHQPEIIGWANSLTAKRVPVIAVGTNIGIDQEVAFSKSSVDPRPLGIEQLRRRLGLAPAQEKSKQIRITKD